MTTAVSSSVGQPSYQAGVMKVIEWQGAQNMRVGTRPIPTIVDPKDAILRVTSTTVCGSDLHMYHNRVPGIGAMQKGDVLGHEFMGIIQQVGSQCTTVRPGDRVVVSAVIACGMCSYCRAGEFSLCDNTNPSTQMEELYGHKTAGVFGYTHLTGGYQGGQAEYVRVPFADVNCLQVPPQLSDEQALFLSDIACTGWHANELGKVKAGDNVVIWGCGPVGLMAIQWAKFRGAGRIIAIDRLPYRLEFAYQRFGIETLNYKERDVVETMKAIFPHGADVCIDCAGYRFPKSPAHKLQTKLRLETDALDAIDEMVKVGRKRARLVLIGDYFGYGNMFPIGGLMEKGQKLTGSQVFVQKYWRELLNYIQRGDFDPTMLITHRMTLDEIPRAYEMFDKHQDDVIKVFVSVWNPAQGQP